MDLQFVLHRIRDGLRLLLPRWAICLEAMHSIERPAMAEARARGLLLRLLNPVQREQFQHCGYFTVEVIGRGGLCVLPCPMFNVLELETGDCYCALPNAKVPLADLMLAQKLFLENDAERFFSIANRRPEVAPRPADEVSLPERVLQARANRARSRVKCWDVSMIPHESHLP